MARKGTKKVNKEATKAKEKEIPTAAIEEKEEAVKAEAKEESKDVVGTPDGVKDGDEKKVEGSISVTELVQKEAEKEAQQKKERKKTISDIIREHNVERKEKFDMWITNLFTNKSLVIVDLKVKAGNDEYPLILEPKQSINLSELGLTKQDVVKSTYLKRFIQAGYIADGKADEQTKFISPELFQSDPRMITAGLSKVEGSMALLKTKPSKNWYLQKLREIEEEEKRRNERVGINDGTPILEE